MGLFSSSSYEKEDKRYNELIKALRKPIEERTLEEYDEDWHPSKLSRTWNQAESYQPPVQLVVYYQPS